MGLAPKASEVPPSSSGYVPPKGGPKKGRTKSGKTGWQDSKGNIWVPDPSNHGGEHWDVEGKNGYINVGRNGRAWGGKGKVTLPKSAKSKIDYGRLLWGFVFVIAIVGIIWIIASVFSIAGAAALVFA